MCGTLPSRTRLGGIGAVSRERQSESTTSQHSHTYNGIQVSVFPLGNGKKLYAQNTFGGLFQSVMLQL